MRIKTFRFMTVSWRTANRAENHNVCEPSSFLKIEYSWNWGELSCQND